MTAIVDDNVSKIVLLLTQNLIWRLLYMIMLLR